MSEVNVSVAQRRGLIARHHGLVWLSARETVRVLKLWVQTIAAPVVSALLFIVVFGLSMSGRITQIDGVDYDTYIVPGLVAMAMVQAAYSNNSSSVFQARFDRYLHDVLAAPMRTWEVQVGLSIGGAVRALIIGVVLVLLSAPVVHVPIERPLVLVAIVALTLVLFSSLGVVVGIYAESFDHQAFVANIVLTPLTFLGGVFYSIDRLPEPWREVSYANPIFYLVCGYRDAFLGTSDIATGVALGVTAALAVAATLWCSWLLASGRRIKA